MSTSAERRPGSMRGASKGFVELMVTEPAMELYEYGLEV